LYITNVKTNVPKPKPSLDATIAATILSSGELKFTVRVGSLIIRSLGKDLLKLEWFALTLHLGKICHDNLKFHDTDCIYPLGFCLAFRFPAIPARNTGDASEDIRRNATYVFDITEDSNKPRFRIQRENLYPNDPLSITSFSISGNLNLPFLVRLLNVQCSDVWYELKKRKSQRYWANGDVSMKGESPPLEIRNHGSQTVYDSESEDSDSEESSVENNELKTVVLYEIGLTRPWVRKMIESLPFANRCVNYLFRFVIPTKEQLERNSM